MGEYIIYFEAFFMDKTAAAGNVVLTIDDPDSLSAQGLHNSIVQALVNKTNKEYKVKLRSKIPILITMMYRHK